ncbi:MAG TPA: hypothetical protein VL418_17975 [Devosiaceae bacterium]|nr:hypothetical protein [Devosiaceae bacterium]
MTFSKVALALMTIGTLAMSPPAFAAGEGKNAESGHQGRDQDQGGVSNDVSGATCYSRDTAGNEIRFDCPTNPAQ